MRSDARHVWVIYNDLETGGDINIESTRNAFVLKNHIRADGGGNITPEGDLGVWHNDFDDADGFTADGFGLGACNVTDNTKVIGNKFKGGGPIEIEGTTSCVSRRNDPNVLCTPCL